MLIILLFDFMANFSVATDIRRENARSNYIVVGGSTILSSAITEELDATIHLQYSK